MNTTNQFSPNSHDTVSIQNSYKLYVTPGGVLTCDDVIKIPLAYKTEIISRANGLTYQCIPGVEIITPNSEFNIKITTNEGITVEPLYTLSQASNVNPYLNPRFFFSLPSNATGIKGVVFKSKNKSLRANLQFGIMPPPYNYDIAMIGVNSHLTEYTISIQHKLERNVLKIEGRVDDLKNKTDNLKLTTKTPTFASVELPRGAGKQTINIKDGALFYNTVFSYTTSSEPHLHRPIITLHGGGRDQVYTLSLNKTIDTVSIDLFTGMITAYDGVTGEIIQQFKLAIPYTGFETLSFDDYYDIDEPILRIYARGSRVE